jgi:hypothetical protein
MVSGLQEFALVQVLVRQLTLERKRPRQRRRSCQVVAIGVAMLTVAPVLLGHQNLRPRVQSQRARPKMRTLQRRLDERYEY